MIKYNLGDKVSYLGYEGIFIVVGIREKEIEIKGVFNKGIEEKCWILIDSIKPYIFKITDGLTEDDVEWIVNDNAELGVKIGQQFFFLYKGASIVYNTGLHDDKENKIMYRPVFKREFGECCHPINYKDYSKRGTVSLDDSDEWKPITPLG